MKQVRNLTGQRPNLQPAYSVQVALREPRLRDPVALRQVHLGSGLLLDPVTQLLETPSMAIVAVTRLVTTSFEIIYRHTLVVVCTQVRTLTSFSVFWSDSSRVCDSRSSCWSEARARGQ